MVPSQYTVLVSVLLAMQASHSTAGPFPFAFSSKPGNNGPDNPSKGPLVPVPGPEKGPPQELPTVKELDGKTLETCMEDRLNAFSELTVIGKPIHEGIDTKEVSVHASNVGDDENGEIEKNVYCENLVCTWSGWYHGLGYTYSSRPWDWQMYNYGPPYYHGHPYHHNYPFNHYLYQHDNIYNSLQIP